MKILLWVAGFGLIAGGCASTAPPSAWGKAGVSRINYSMDVDMCAGFALAQDSGSNGAYNAGGISGANNSASTNSPGASGSLVSGSAIVTGGAVTAPASSVPLPPGASYSGMVSTDYAQRAANQQRSQEMAVQRARSEALRSCLSERGYQQIVLTAEQRAHLATLKKGSHEYSEYLYRLGSDAEIVGKQGRAAVQ